MMVERGKEIGQSEHDSNFCVDLSIEMPEHVRNFGLKGILPSSYCRIG